MAKGQGFASYQDKAKLREVQSRGGRNAVNRPKWTPEEAAHYGRIGGKISKRPPGRKES